MFGTALKFDRIKGFGFILPADDPTMPDAFCHATEIQPSAFWKRKFLIEGMKVEFDVEFDEGDVDHDRPRAKNVRACAPVNIARQVSDGNIAPRNDLRGGAK
jgi:cold shock CspA family protein